MSRLHVVAEFAAVRWLRPLRTRAAVERRQRRLLRRHLRFLATRSPYFRGLAQGRALQLSQLPLMDKAVMMTHFDELNTVGVQRDDALRMALDGERTRDFAEELDGCSVGMSSGTSGHRGLFVVSTREREAWAGTVLARALPRGRMLGHRIALFLRADNTLYESVASKAVSFEYFDVFDDLQTNLARLADFAPTILVAPPSVLLQIAQRSTALGIAPQKVYSVAEVLEQRDADRIRRDFGIPVLHQIYQCTEGFLAHSCEHGTVHLNEDSVLFEREELGDGRFVPIVTDLRRRAQPIVRYRLGDILRVRQAPCPCGSALTGIDRIEGREGDTLQLSGSEGGTVPVFADAIGRVMLFVDGIRDYRLVQTARDALEVHLDTDDDEVRKKIADEILTLLDRLGCERPQLSFEMYLPDARSKMRRVRRDWMGDDDEKL